MRWLTVLIPLPISYNGDGSGQMQPIEESKNDDESRARIESYAANTLLSRFKQEAIYLRFFSSEVRLIQKEIR